MESYFGHVAKDRIAAVVAEVVGEGEAKPLQTMKKADAAAAAERLLAGKGWLPEPLQALAAEQHAKDDE